MRDQGAPESLPLMIGVDVELVDEITVDGQKSRDAPLELRHPDIMADEHDAPEILAIFLRRVALPRLEIGKGPEAGAPPEIVHRVEVSGLVSTDGRARAHARSVRRRRPSRMALYPLAVLISADREGIPGFAPAESAHAVPDGPAREGDRAGKPGHDVDEDIEIHAAPDEN